MKNVLKNLSFWRSQAHPQPATLPLFEQFVDTMPSAQNAVDLLPGWSTCLPPQFNAVAGSMALFADFRIAWALECFGAIEGRKVLELGPLEASHTYMLHEAGAEIDAIEANKIAFLKCLIAKEIMGLTHASFYLGDFIKWLESTEFRYDLVIACGVLYHQTDPLRLLELISKRSQAVYYWTHYISDADRVNEVRDYGGQKIRFSQRSYAGAEAHVAFTGGMRDAPCWIHRDDLICVLRMLGYTTILETHDQADHPNGPAISIFARKD